VIASDSTQLHLGGFELDEEKKAEYKSVDEIGAWKPVGLQKTGKGSFREDRPNMFYPIYWNESSNTFSLERQSKEDYEIFPIFTDGREGRWRWGKDTFQLKASSELIAKVQKRGPVIYVKMRDVNAEGVERQLKPKSIWLDPKYDSGSATQLLKKILGGKLFDNPKPVKFISDLLSIATSKDSTVLDFFAGTGTTLHAVAQLNSTDGGQRRCILVTNNENNICMEVTQPRVKAVLTGDWADGKHEALPGALQFYRTDFIARKKNQDRMRVDIARHTVDLITIKEAAIPIKEIDKSLNVLRGHGHTIAIVTDALVNHKEAERKARSHAKEGDDLVAYLFTWSDHGVESELAELWPKWKVEPLPADMLAQLRKLKPAQYDLFDEYPDGVAK
jgi:adenine-specific DNA-methyltransferase